ncbi:MAG TPA: PEP-CTERM sorting domain-containing protein [Phycisphaerae bacterium]|nr:PEP-CTERM sorting domain-containing protein [Phycisphaerae bacterium]
MRPSTSMKAVGLVLAVLGAYPRFVPAAIVDTFIGPPGGNWTTQGNWSLNQVPNSTAFDVLINTPGSSTSFSNFSTQLDAAETVNNLSINASSSLYMTANLSFAGTLTNAGSLYYFTNVLSGTLPTTAIVNSGTLEFSGTLSAGSIVNQNLITSLFTVTDQTMQIRGSVDNTGGTIEASAAFATGNPYGNLDLRGTITGGTVKLLATRASAINGGAIIGSNLSLSGATTLTLVSGSMNVTAPIFLQTLPYSFSIPTLETPTIVFNSTVPNSQNVGAILPTGTGSTVSEGGLIAIGANATLTADQIVATNLTLGTNAALILRPHGGDTPATTYRAFSLGSNSLLDLGDNKLIVNSTVAKSTLIAQLGGQINSGRNGGNWLGKGISSSTVAADQSATGSHHLTISLFDNADLNLSTFGGQPANTQSLFVAASLIADSNADNQIDAVDFDAWFNHQLASTSLASRGDYNGDGIVNGLDFSLWFNAAGGLAQPLLDSRGLNAGALAAVGGVPEPASAALVLTVVPWLLARRRRRNVGA